MAVRQRASEYVYAPIDHGTPDTCSALWRAVYNDPWDAAPRLVLADWYEERGDPIHESLRLQPGGYDELAQDHRPATRLARRRATGLGYMISNRISYHDRQATIWAGRYAQFYQAVREGYFLTFPIQRVIILDLPSLAVEMGPPGPVVILRPSIETQTYIELERKIQAAGFISATAETGSGAIEECIRFASLPYALAYMSMACVSIGRHASGLPAEVPAEPDLIGLHWNYETTLTIHNETPTRYQRFPPVGGYGNPDPVDGPVWPEPLYPSPRDAERYS